MLLCIVVSCGTTTGNKDGRGMLLIFPVIKNQGEQMEELTTRREKCISVISRGNTEYKNLLQSEQVCGRHFVTGSPAKHWDKHNVQREEYKDDARKG